MRDHLGPTAKVESDTLKIKLETSLVNNSYFELKSESRVNKDFKIGVSWDNSNYQSFTFVQPLTDDKTTYLINVKKGARPLKGFYKFKGKQYDCNETLANCLTLYDVGRGYANYGGAYFWANVQTVLEDGTLFMMNLGDGIGSEYHSYDKASEDHLVVDGQIFKLDVTEMEYSKEDYMKEKKLKTATSVNKYSKKKFPERYCDVTFTPLGQINEAVNFIAIAFSQNLVFGNFNGVCEIEGGRRFELKNAYGHVEHVYSRW